MINAPYTKLDNIPLTPKWTACASIGICSAFLDRRWGELFDPKRGRAPSRPAFSNVAEAPASAPCSVDGAAGAAHYCRLYSSPFGLRRNRGLIINTREQSRSWSAQRSVASALFLRRHIPLLWRVVAPSGLFFVFVSGRQSSIPAPAAEGLHKGSSEEGQLLHHNALQSQEVPQRWDDKKVGDCPFFPAHIPLDSTLTARGIHYMLWTARAGGEEIALEGSSHPSSAKSRGAALFGALEYCA